ncbi:unnamed protein product [Brugia pahangi]|uniref:Uncharacterized protein n=1 Tax=Brugia pahangi TaxID=6280 RepID=A0A0N4T7I3_BRUPA|nr:unnamed protein product [Brugia pahangi]
MELINTRFELIFIINQHSIIYMFISFMFHTMHRLVLPIFWRM